MSNIGRGIPISVGFDLGANIPLDARSTVNTKADLDVLVEDNIACYGLTVFVLEDETYYQYLGNNVWEEIGRLGKVQSLIDITADKIETRVENFEKETKSKITQTDEKIPQWYMFDNEKYTLTYALKFVFEKDKKVLYTYYVKGYETRRCLQSLA